MKKSKKWLLRLALGIPLIVCAGFIGLVSLFNAPKYAEREAANRAAAEVIIESLDSHFTAEGAYPEFLTELDPPVEVPDQMSYRRKDDGGFMLSYPEAPIGTLPTDGFHEYESASGQWKMVVY